MFRTEEPRMIALLAYRSETVVVETRTSSRWRDQLEASHTRHFDSESKADAVQ